MQIYGHGYISIKFYLQKIYLRTLDTKIYNFDEHHLTLKNFTSLMFFRLLSLLLLVANPYRILTLDQVVC